jgi:large subunit ribosomal protein L17
MLASLVARDRIETTLAKAKELRPMADKLVTLAKSGSLASRRVAYSLLRDDVSLKKLFTTLVVRYRERNGGYTRIMKLGVRHGDCAPMAVLEYLTADIKAEAKPSDSKKKKAVKKTKK